MDLSFNKKTKINTFKGVYLSHITKNLIRAEQSFISYNYTKLTYIYAIYVPTRTLTYLQVLNGPLLSIFSEYSKVLRKSILPWLCAIKLSKKAPSKSYLLVLKPFSLRHRNVLRDTPTASSLVLTFRWSSPFYRVRRIKRWLSKKYTNRLWR